MIRFLKLNIIFLSLLAVFSYSFDYMITAGLKKTDIRKFQSWNDIYSQNINEEVIVIGNSRVWTQYNVRILDSIVGLDFYNLAIDGHPIDYQLIKYNTYRRFNRKPKYIIQNIDFLTLALQKDGYEREQFFPYVNDDTLMQQVSRLKNITWFDIHIPFIRYYGYKNMIENGISSFWGKTKFEEGGVYKGYKGLTAPWSNNAFKNTEKINYWKEPVALKLFENYLQKCKQENIKVLLVSAPIYSEIKQKITGYNEINNTFIFLAKKYNCEFLDYTTENICNDSTLFINGTHLNKNGAEQFSRTLAIDLKHLLNE